MHVERVDIPAVLAKPRDHAVICTFGAELTFYEGPLWRHVARARNRVVLADDAALAHALSDAASSGSVLRHANINYVVSPVTNLRSAHAKLILLTDSAGGTLLVGSGNLSLDGYASRGETFCRYDVSGDDGIQLGAFLAAKELLDVMSARGYLDTQVHQHLEHMWSDAPWIWKAASGGVTPVRHNLVIPLAEQLVDFVGDEPVIDVIVHAPFYDRRCEALRRLLVALRPAHVTVLLQERRTSVDSLALTHVLESCDAAADIRLAAAPDFPATPLHAKFVLVRTPARSVMFVGSANLSLAALFRTDESVDDEAAGNIEVVNLFEGTPEAIDELLAGLDLADPVSPTATLDVRYLGDDPAAADRERPRLQRGVWDGTTLLLEAAAPLPGDEPALVIGGRTLPAELAVESAVVQGRPGSEAAASLDRGAVPVWLRFGAGDRSVETTPVYPYHPGSLANLLTGRRDPELLRKAGDLDIQLDDPDLSALLEELDASLVIDGNSLWRLAGRPIAADPSTSDGPRLRWEDLDFETLRRHPKLAQYQSSFGRQVDSPGATDLQIILAAITERFQGMGRRAPSGDPPTGAPSDIELEDPFGALTDDHAGTPVDEMPEEVEANDNDDEEHERRRLKIETRNRHAWQRFCDRFGRGLRDPDFTDLVGPHVVITNAIIFNHLLALLVAKEVIDAERGVAHQLELWRFLWGDRNARGYFDSLDDDTQLDAMEALTERGVDSVVLAAVDVACRLTRHGERDELRSDLRDTWRHLLESSSFSFTTDVISHAATPGVRSAAGIAQGLDQLAHEWKTQELHAALAACLGTTESAIRATQATIRRRIRDERVDILLVDDPVAILDSVTAAAAFSVWAAMDRDREYFRLHQPATGTTAVWDRASHECWWFRRRTDEGQVTLDEPIVAEPRWAIESRRLLDTARAADQIVA